MPLTIAAVEVIEAYPNRTNRIGCFGWGADVCFWAVALLLC